MAQGQPNLCQLRFVLQAKTVTEVPMPPLFQFLTLLAFKIFLSEKVGYLYLCAGMSCDWKFVILIYSLHFYFFKKNLTSQ